MKLNQFVFPLVLVGGLFYFAGITHKASAAEPIYQDQPESYWVNLLTNNLKSFAMRSQWPKLGSNALPVLVKAVKMKKGENAATIRTNAAFLLAQNADSKTLITIANDTFDSQVKALVLNGLIRNADPDVTATMINALSDKNPQVRLTGLFGLAEGTRKRVPEELPAIIKCLQDIDPDVRCCAARLLEHYYPYPSQAHQEQNQFKIEELACIEITKAVSNTDPLIRSAASVAVGRGEAVVADEKKRPSVDYQGEKFEKYLMVKKSRAVLAAYMRELAIYLAELHGNKWTATIHVENEEGKPMQGAAVIVSYSVLPGLLSGGDDVKNIEGISDSNGVFAATHVDSSFEIEVEVQKEGCYRSQGLHKLAFPGQFDNQKVASSRNPEVTIALKKIIRPVPMFVNRVDIAHRDKPAMDKPVGFDLTIGDFIAPYGKGTNAQMFFTWHVEYETNEILTYNGKQINRGCDDRMTISFPNPGDGIIEFDLPTNNPWSGFVAGSELRSPQLAPLEGYQSQLVKTRRWNFGKLGSHNDYDHLHKNYIFRVNTVLDEKGNIKSAQYGKIHGDFEEGLRRI